MLGLAANSYTTEHLRRSGECVLSLPSTSLGGNVDRIARTTGSDPVPEGKRRRGYRHVSDKFAEAGLTPICSTTAHRLGIPQRASASATNQRRSSGRTDEMRSIGRSETEAACGTCLCRGTGIAFAR
jgi:hypothetical protein